MSRAKGKPREITVADIAARFELASYWFGRTWCPAVDTSATGYSIRVVKSQVGNRTTSATAYDYFELAGDGTVLIAPWGHAKDWRPCRVVDVDAAVEQYATPDPDASRIGTPW